ncbi:MAG: M23 family metallopeptidase [Clostridia bacterium]|nr:M23 family metallopeptidase [Clostridia bacterium]
MSRRDYFKEEDKLRKISIVFGITLVLTIVVFTLVFNLYNKKLEENARQSILELGSINAVVPNSYTNSVTSASTTEDKGVNEVKNEIASTEIKKQELPKHKVAEEPERNEEENVIEEPKSETVEPEPITFSAPINGEIIKDFANETLVYSETLEEWTVHNGIDIKAPKTTVVMASAEGMVESIKNDPRYGLTVTITHRDGFKTIYSNLLTAEFVSEGQEVEKGRTIGTVGESASFEAVEEAHLHFEMMKDGKYVNPTLYFN